MKKNIEASDIKLVFLNYINRSGSTLLCKLLDQYEDISVGIEAGFPGYIRKLIPDEYKEINDDLSLKKYLNELFDDVRFKEWEIDKKSLFLKLKDISYPLTFKEILLNCLYEYFKQRPSKFIVHKAGYYIDIIDDVIATFGDVKNIFIVRDPRAIFFSQKNAKDLYTGKIMGNSLPYFLSQYKKRIDIIEKKNDKNLLCIRYEDLVIDTTNTMKQIINFIGARQIKKNDNSYVNKIPKSQQYLHQNVKLDPHKDSLNKWKTGLAKYEIIFIQKKLHNEMQLFNYDPINITLSGAKEKWLYLNLTVRNISFHARAILSIVKTRFFNSIHF